MLDTALKTIETAANHLGWSAERLAEFSQPDAVHHQTLQLPDGHKLEAFRVQHNHQRGPYKGGLRFHPDVNQEEVTALATLMSLKTACLDLPLGGGKGGVVVDPSQIDQAGLEVIARQYVRQFGQYLGPKRDIPAPDVNTDSQVMDWMVDEYQRLSGDSSKACFTGKSVANGGSRGRQSATGRGGFFVLSQLLSLLPDMPKRPKIAIQGFGNAGGWFARVVSKHQPDWRVVAVSDSSGGLYRHEGLDLTLLSKFKRDGGHKLASFYWPGYQVISNQQLLEAEVDVLVLAALGNSITRYNQAGVKAKLILELANGPVTSVAQTELEARGCQIVPDILASGGGVVVSYFEWLQNLNAESWSAKRVNQQLHQVMAPATAQIYQLASEQKIGLKQAAFVRALAKFDQPSSD